MVSGGAFWVGFVSEHWGVSRALVVKGAIGLVSVGALVAWRRWSRKPERH